MADRKLNRKELEKVYGHLYTYPNVSKHRCHYCGEVAMARDHVPPLSMLEKVPLDKFIDMGIKFYIYPSCITCNAALGPKPLVTLFDRLNHLFDYYSKKIELQESWTEYELSQLSGRLKQFIQGQQYKIAYYNKKLEHIDKRIRGLLNDSEDHTVIL